MAQSNLCLITAAEKRPSYLPSLYHTIPYLTLLRLLLKATQVLSICANAKPKVKYLSDLVLTITFSVNMTTYVCIFQEYIEVNAPICTLEGYNTVAQSVCAYTSVSV